MYEPDKKDFETLYFFSFDSLPTLQITLFQRKDFFELTCIYVWFGDQR